MKTLKVELGARSYPILIGDGLLTQSELLRLVPARDVLIVSNTTVAPLYLDALAGALRPRRVIEVILPDGESHKTLTNISRILVVLVANRFGREVVPADRPLIDRMIKAVLLGVDETAKRVREMTGERRRSDDVREALRRAGL